MIRIAVTGPESCGKTTFAKTLADQLNCPWVPEFAREYLSDRGLNYEQEDLDKILLGQLKKWEELSDKPIVIYDTEILVLKIWSEFKYNNCSKLILNQLSEQKIDLYLLCAPDIPYEEDELRENANDREKLFEIYQKELDILQANYVIISGNRTKKMTEIVSIIKGKIYS